MPVKVAHWFESLSNAVTDGKIAEILRAKIDLIESQLTVALLRAEKAEANNFVLEDENKKLHAELADIRKVTRPSDKLEKGTEDVLQYLFSHGPFASVDDIGSAFGFERGVVEFHIDELKRLNLATKRPAMRSAMGFQPVTAGITNEGRAYVMKNLR